MLFLGKIHYQIQYDSKINSGTLFSYENQEVLMIGRYLLVCSVVIMVLIFNLNLLLTAETKPVSIYDFTVKDIDGKGG